MNTQSQWKTLEKSKGYPVPQGNLSNFSYGNTLQSMEKMRSNWKSVMYNHNKYVEHFTPPRPNTVLHN